MEAYLFDMGNVVLSFDHRRFCRRLAGEQKHLHSEEIYTFVFQEEGPNDRFELGRLNGQDFYSELKDTLGLSLSMDIVRDLWCDMFWENPGINLLLEALQARARLILVSNTNYWHIDYIQNRFTVLSHFHDLVLSYEVGARKPDSRIFKAALSAAGTEPNRCLFIDDHAPNIKAANKLGIPSVLFNYHGFCKEDF